MSQNVDGFASEFQGEEIEENGISMPQSTGQV